MYRIIFFLIAILFEVFFPDSRYSRYGTMFGRRRYNRMYNFFEDYDTPSTNKVSDKIRANLRRRKALGKCKNFLTKDKYILTIKNKNVILVFDSQNKTMTLVDNKIKGRAATVAWEEQVYILEGNNDNTFEKTFDNICISFDENANYVGILTVLKEVFKVQETNPLPKLPKRPISEDDAPPIKLTPRTRSLEKLNINDATEEELASLPGISIIIAKRIIKYRDEHNGFKTKDEFYREMKIKPHFQEKLNDLVRVNKSQKSIKETKKNERIIDF